MEFNYIIFRTSLIVLLCFPKIVYSSLPPISLEFQNAFVAEAKRHIDSWPDVKNSSEPFINSLRVLSDKQDPVAQFILAVSNDNASKDSRMKLLRESATGGCSGAATILGMQLIAENRDEGISWIKRGAHEGDATAQFILAEFINKGAAGFELNSVEGLVWMRIAERQTLSYSFRVLLLSRIDEMRSGLSPDDRPKADKRFEVLGREIAVAPDHICGQSQLGRDIKPTLITIFDLFPAVTSVEQIQAVLAKKHEKPVVIIVTARWDLSNDYIAWWFRDGAISKGDFDCCEVIIADITDGTDKSILSYYNAIGAPLFVAYDRENMNKPSKIKSGGFLAADTLVEWFRDLSN